MSIHCEIQERDAQPTLSVRVRTSVSELPNLMARYYGAIMAYLGEVGQFPTGAPYGAYYNLDTDDLDVEIGFPVATALPGKDDIQPGEVPAGKYATCVWVGPYDESEAAYDALATFIAEQGYEPVGVAYEVYLNDPGEVPPEELQTEIAFPLKG